MRPRSFLRRVALAISSALLLQLVLLGSGTLCDMRGGATHDEVAMSGMAGMPGMPATPAASADEGDTAPVIVASCNADEEGCPQPWAPGSCSTMTTCTISAVPVTLSAGPATATALAPDLPVIVLASRANTAT